MGTVSRAAVRAGELGPAAIELARALVRANTVNRHSGDAQPGNEANGQRILRPILEGLGARTELFDCPPDIYELMGVLGPRDRDVRDRPNLVGLLEYGAGGPTILLQGHMDTVGIEDMTLAQPLSGELRDGKLWGRGSTDMKGGLAAAVTALQALHDVRGELRGRVVFASVVEEESNGSGAGALAVLARARAGGLLDGAVRPSPAGSLADVAICTDGTGPAIFRGYGGVLTVDVHVEGRAGHAAGGGGVSAIEKAIVVKEAIDRFRAEREVLGAGRNVNLGIFRGGVHPAVVPGRAMMSLNMSYPHAEAVAADAAGEGFGNAPARRRFEALVATRCTADPWLRDHPPRVDWIKDLLPFEVPPEHPLVRDLAAAHERVLGEPPEIAVSPAWSDACYLPRFAATPVVCYGAGTPGMAHGPTEYVDTWRIVACARVLADFLHTRLRA